MNKNCKVVLVVAMILSMMSFFSCSSGDGGGDGGSGNGLAGTKWVSKSDSSNYIEFYSGGTAYISKATGSGSNNVTYSYSGGSGEFKLSYSGASTTIGTFKISGDKLTFYMVGASQYGADYYKESGSGNDDDKKDDDDKNNSVVNGLAGTKWVSSSDSSNYIEFYSGGTAYISKATGNGSGNITYTYSGGTGEFKLSYSGASTTIGTFKISGDKLTFYMVGASQYGADYYKESGSGNDDEKDDDYEDGSSKYPDGTPWWNNKRNYDSFEKMDLAKSLLDDGYARLVYKGTSYDGKYDFVVYYDWYEDEYYGSSEKVGYYYKVNDGVDSFTIPTYSISYSGDSYVKIADSAFAGQSWLKSITIPSTIETISENAFSSNKLETINFKGTVETWCKIGGNVSKYLVYKKGVINFVDQYLPSYIDFDGVDSICDYAFYNCTNITSLSIGSSVTSIGEKAFYGCIGLDWAIFYDFTGWRYYPYGSYYSSLDVSVGYDQQQCAANLIGRNGCEEDWSRGMYKSY